MTSKQKKIENRKNKFLKHLAETSSNVLRSCERSGLTRNTALRHYDKDPYFRERWNKITREERNCNRAGCDCFILDEFEKIPLGVQIVEERFSSIELLNNKFKKAEWLVKCNDNKSYKIVVQDFESFKIVEHQYRKIRLRRLLKFDQIELELKLKPLIKNPMWRLAWKEVFYAQSV